MDAICASSTLCADVLATGHKSTAAAAATMVETFMGNSSMIGNPMLAG
jgi:hypothetical protein